MKRFAWVLTLIAASGLAAQEPRQPPPDSARAERLRAEIERRFGERVKDELGLSDQQAAKLKGTQEKFGERRRELMREQLETRRALQRQMRPGEPANADSVRVLLDRQQRWREQMLKLEQEEDREMANYLTPVQRARFQMMRQRFHDRLSELRQERRGMLGPERGVRPGGAPRMRPGGGQIPRRRP